VNLLRAASKLPGSKLGVRVREHTNMPRHKDQKRIIRNRMKKTGESYTTARARVIAKTPPAQPKIDHAKLAGMSDAKISGKTGRTWQEWTRTLDADGAATMSHRDIATLVHSKHSVGDWWAQTVTVGYERIKGLRERGQRRSGEYEATKSRTFDVPIDALFDAWADDTVRRKWLGLNTAVRTATKPKSMRLQWPDGTIIAINFMAKGRDKSAVALAHTKLPTRVAADEAKTYWSARLDALGKELV
jgi:hypothetical protein